MSFFLSFAPNFSFRSHYWNDFKMKFFIFSSALLKYLHHNPNWISWIQVNHWCTFQMSFTRRSLKSTKVAPKLQLHRVNISYISHWQLKIFEIFVQIQFQSILKLKKMSVYSFLPAALVQFNSLIEEPRAQFHANHPFIFYIWNEITETIIFSGRITKFWSKMPSESIKKLLFC